MLPVEGGIKVLLQAQLAADAGQRHFLGRDLLELRLGHLYALLQAQDLGVVWSVFLQQLPLLYLQVGQLVGQRRAQPRLGVLLHEILFLPLQRAQAFLDLVLARGDVRQGFPGLHALLLQVEVAVGVHYGQNYIRGFYRVGIKGGNGDKVGVRQALHLVGAGYLGRRLPAGGHPQFGRGALRDLGGGDHHQLGGHGAPGVEFLGDGTGDLGIRGRGLYLYLGLASVHGGLQARIEHRGENGDGKDQQGHPFAPVDYAPVIVKGEFGVHGSVLTRHYAGGDSEGEQGGPGDEIVGYPFRRRGVGLARDIDDVAGDERDIALHLAFENVLEVGL